jgi:hypothetical protein
MNLKRQFELVNSPKVTRQLKEERIRRLWYFRTWALQEVQHGSSRWKYYQEEFRSEWLDVLCFRYTHDMLTPEDIKDFNEWYPLHRILDRDRRSL